MHRAVGAFICNMGGGHAKHRHRHGTARHGAARHGTARRGASSPARQTRCWLLILPLFLRCQRYPAAIFGTGSPQASPPHPALQFPHHHRILILARRNFDLFLAIFNNSEKGILRPIQKLTPTPTTTTTTNNNKACAVMNYIMQRLTITAYTVHGFIHMMNRPTRLVIKAHA